MKFFVVLACFVAAVFANENANVLRSEAEVDAVSFKTALELDDGQSQHQQGQLKTVADGEAIVQTGDFGWKSPEGEEIKLTYVADENGYQPVAAHLPTPPPIPAHIIKAIEYINAHTK